MASYALLSGDLITPEDLVILGFDPQHASNILNESDDTRFIADPEEDEDYFTSQMDREVDVLDAFRLFERADETFRPKHAMTVAEINNHQHDLELGIL